MHTIVLRSVALASVLLTWGCGASSRGPGAGASGNGSSSSGSGGTNAGASNGSGGAGSGGAPADHGSGGTGGKVEGTGGTSTAVAGSGTGGGTGGSAVGGSDAGGRAGSSGSAGLSAGAGGSGGSGASGGSGGSGGSGAGTSSSVTVKLDATHQTIEGFGINTAFSESAAPWDTLLGTDGGGLGLSIVRVAMTTSGQVAGVLPPSTYNAKVIGAPFSAPASCKDNNETEKGGHLLASCYDSWSTTIAKFAMANGLYAVGPAQEPDFASCGLAIGPPCNGDFDSMVFTAKEMVDFVNVLGPKLQTAGVKLIAPEPAEWIHLWSNTSATGSTVTTHPNSSDPLNCGCFGNDPVTSGCASTCEQGNGYDYGHWLAKDPTAWGLIDILGTHEYDTQKAMAWPSDVDNGKRTKEVWQTDMSGNMYWPEQGPSSDIANGVVVAEWIHSALVVGEASAWLYFWYQPLGNDDNEGLVLKNSTTPTKRYYTLGNYSKFVRPGAVMVEVTGNSNPDLLLSAFTGADGTVIVAINKGTTDLSVPIAVSGGTAPASCSPYVTSATDDIMQKTAVPVTNGTVTASFAATTVTTLVCK